MSRFRKMAVVLCLATAVPAFAEESAPKISKLWTARGFVDYYRSNKEHDVAKAYVSGLLDGFANAYAKVMNETGQHLFCWPEQFPIVEDQLISIVDQYVEKHQKVGAAAFSTVAAIALTDAFPCKKP